MMKDYRHGDYLWVEWSGEGYEPQTDTDLIFYTEEVVNLSVPLIQKALASSLQRDGVVDSLSDGFFLVNNSTTVHGFVGNLPGDIVPLACDALGLTLDGTKLETFSGCTWVEMPNF